MHPAAEPERHTIDSENAAHALHLLRAHPADRDGRAPVLLLHGSTLPGSIAYTLRFDGRSWLDDLAERGRDVWSLDIRGYGGSWHPEDSGDRPCAPVADTAQALEDVDAAIRSEEHTSALQSLIRISYAVS